MAINTSNANPLVITVEENLKIRPIFRQSATETPIVQTIGVESPVVVESTWRDCLDGGLRTGMPPAEYVQVTYTGAGGGTCWEPKATIGFEPDLSEVLKFDWRRGTDTYPEAKNFKITNPSATAFAVKVTTNEEILVRPSNFNLAPRSSETITIKATSELLNKLGDGISTINFNVEITEII